MTVEPFTELGPDASNPGYVLITVRGHTFSIPDGMEQSVADEVAANLGN